MKNSEMQYGIQDASYLAAGQLEGITALVTAFYHYMDVLPQARAIRAMHPAALESSKDKLTLFLCGWLGGPRMYQAKYGSISIPEIHKNLAVGASERDAWLSCMKLALDDQGYPESFKTYLLEQLFIPAERIRSVCAHNV
jgi:hemoglobin